MEKKVQRFRWKNCRESVSYTHLDVYKRQDLDTAGLRVAQKYVVNGDNPNYAATEAGILTDKEVTEILGIPYAIKKITIPAGIRCV